MPSFVIHQHAFHCQTRLYQDNALRGMARAVVLANIGVHKASALKPAPEMERTDYAVQYNGTYQEIREFVLYGCTPGTPPRAIGYALLRRNRRPINGNRVEATLYFDEHERAAAHDFLTALPKR